MSVLLNQKTEQNSVYSNMEFTNLIGLFSYAETKVKTNTF